MLATGETSPKKVSDQNGNLNYAQRMSSDSTISAKTLNLRTISGNRSIVLLSIKIAERKFLVEASPLAGFSSDTQEQVLAEIAQINHGELKEILSNPAHPSSRTALSSLSSSSLRFAIESAWLDSLLESKVVNLQSTEIKCNALIYFRDPETLISDLNKKIASGFRRVKIKISSENLVCFCKALDRFYTQGNSTDLHLRIDPNRSLTHKETEILINSLSQAHIEYIEEPTSDLEYLPSLIERSPIPIALDETAREMPIDEWISWRNLKHLVVKPTLLGGAFTVQNLKSRLDKAGIKLTISSAFESDVGLRSIAILCAFIGFQGFAGLDTASSLLEHTTNPPFPAGVPIIDATKLALL